MWRLRFYNMVITENGKNVGICCDLCSSSVRDKFIYYSGKIDMVEVDSAIQKVGVVSIDRRFLDIDICTICFEQLKARMLSVIKNRESKGKEAKKEGGQWTTTTNK